MISGKTQGGSDEMPPTTPDPLVAQLLEKLRLDPPAGFPGAAALPDTGAVPDARGSLPPGLPGLDTGSVPGGAQLPGGVATPAVP